MSFELLLVMGSILAVLSGVAVLTALIEGRRPRIAAIMVMISGGLLMLAIMKAEDGLQWADVPDAFVTVVASILN